MSTELDYTFHAMGSDIRLLIGPRLVPTAPEPLAAADRERAYVLSFGERLSRFRPDSELSALNHDPRTEVPASPLLRTAVRAGLWAAERSDGLLDPTLVGALERSGYSASLDGAEPAPLSEALARRPRARTRARRSELALARDRDRRRRRRDHPPGRRDARHRRHRQGPVRRRRRTPPRWLHPLRRRLRWRHRGRRCRRATGAL